MKKNGFDRFMNPEDGSRKRQSSEHKHRKRYRRKGKNKFIINKLLEEEYTTGQYGKYSND